MALAKNGILALLKHLEPTGDICIQETLSRIRERVREARVRVYRIHPFLSFCTEKPLILEPPHSSKAGF